MPAYRLEVELPRSVRAWNHIEGHVVKNACKLHAEGVHEQHNPLGGRKGGGEGWGGGTVTKELMFLASM